MTIFDFILFFLMAFSFLLSLFRGIVRELTSLIGLIFGILLAYFYSVELSGMFWNLIENRNLRVMTCAALIIILVVFFFNVVGIVLFNMINKFGLSSADRTLGGLFGILRGYLLVLTIVWLANMTEAPKQIWWKESLLIPYIKATLEILRPYLSDSFFNQINLR